MLLRHLPYLGYNTSYDIAHWCVRTRWWVRTEDDTTWRLCGTDTETVGAALPCPRRQGVAGTVVLFGGAGLNRDDTDEGTLLLSLKLSNVSNGVATSLASFDTSW